MAQCTGSTCFCKRPKPKSDPPAVVSVEIALSRIPQISAYLDSIISARDDGVLKLRLAEIRQEKWTKAEWNVFGISARVALINHSAYSAVLQIVQEMGGY